MSVTRKDIAKAFKACLPYLSAGSLHDRKNTYICHALVVAQEDDKMPSYAAMHAAKMVVMSRLLPHNNVVSWLRDNVTRGEQPTYSQSQKYRRRWVRALIQEFSK